MSITNADVVTYFRTLGLRFSDVKIAMLGIMWSATNEADPDEAHPWPTLWEMHAAHAWCVSELDLLLTRKEWEAEMKEEWEARQVAEDEIFARCRAEGISPWAVGEPDDEIPF